MVLRPRGRTAGGPREAHRARTCGRRPTRIHAVHADAREGATWREVSVHAREDAREGPTG